MDNEEYQDKIIKIQEIYKLYTERIRELKLRQEKLVLNFIKKKEEEKISKIREEIYLSTNSNKTENN